MKQLMLKYSQICRQPMTAWETRSANRKTCAKERWRMVRPVSRVEGGESHRQRERQGDRKRED